MALITPPSLLVICVNYNSDSDAISLAKDFLSQRMPEKVRVLIADNTAREDGQVGLALPDEWRESVTHLPTGGNLGYFGAASMALEVFRRTNPLPDWVAVSNADLSVSGQDFLARLVRSDSLLSFGIVAPSIRSSVTGRDQNPYMKNRPSRFRMGFYKLVFGSRLLTRIYLFLSDIKQFLRKARKNAPADSGTATINSTKGIVPIYAPHGSFILFSRRYFESGGTLAHGTFLFGEEIFVAETARKLGLPVHFDSSLTLTHREHTTTSVVRSDVLFNYRRDAAKYCADTFF